jgi:hypothetical protein
MVDQRSILNPAHIMQAASLSCAQLPVPPTGTALSDPCLKLVFCSAQSIQCTIKQLCMHYGALGDSYDDKHKEASLDLQTWHQTCG